MRTIALAIIMGLISFIAVSCNAQKSGQPKLKSGDSDFVVFEYNPKNYGHIFKNGKPATLSGDEISKARSLVEDAVKEYNAEQKNDDGIIKIKGYRFQFISVINDKNEKEIWVNGFCSAGSLDWTKHLIVVEDGGKCYFNIYVNLSKNSYDRFMVNGDA